MTQNLLTSYFTVNMVSFQIAEFHFAEVLTQISQGELAQTSLWLRFLKMEFALSILVAAEHTTADEQHIHQSYFHRQ